jgi:hypothetical protein
MKIRSIETIQLSKQRNSYKRRQHQFFCVHGTTPNTYYKHQHKLWQLQTQKINKINPTRYNTNTTVNYKQQEETYKQLQDPPTYNIKCKV